MAECKDCKVVRRGSQTDYDLVVELCPLHARAEAYKEALRRIRDTGHTIRCFDKPGEPCDCHVSIAEEALKGTGNVS